MLNKNNHIYQFVTNLPRSIKIISVIFFDISMCIFTVILSFYLITGEFNFRSQAILSTILITLIIFLPIFALTGSYSAIFRYNSLQSIKSILQSVLIYTFLFFIIIFYLNIIQAPKSIGIIQPMLLFFSLINSRILIVIFLGDLHYKKNKIESIKKILIYGAGDAGRQLMSLLENNIEFKVIGYIDDNIKIIGNSINSIPIFSPKDLDKTIIKKKITHIFLAMPSIDRNTRNKIVSSLLKYSVILRTLPNLGQIVSGNINVSDLQDLNYEDILNRPVVAPDYSLLSQNVTNRVVLVSGAGGSIGSEICEQVLRLKPKKLLLLELNEYSLYTIQSKLSSIQVNIGDSDKTRVIPLLASVQDRGRILEILDTWLPHTIFHAAAYKHVPLVEHNLLEGIKNNVLGTLVIAQAAVEKGVLNFVMISTDKAVRPKNIMGASKRLAEMSLQALYDFNKFDSKTNISMVRFGNVLNSSGSVIPLFKKQIQNGGPLTVTHKEITRYFMTLPEAAELVIQASAMAKGGDVFILEMGKQINILELAKHFIKLSGLSIKDKKNPKGDIEIKIIGLRPGEKLFEELILGSNPKNTSHKKIFRTSEPFMVWSQLKEDIEKLKLSFQDNDVIGAINLIKKIIPEYKPTSKIVDGVYVEKQVSKTR